MNEKIRLNDKWVLIIVMPLVGLGIPLAMPDQGCYFTQNHLLVALSSFFHTASIWLGCRFIVIQVWNRIPWNLEPVKHLLVEIVFIAIWTSAINYIGEKLMSVMLDPDSSIFTQNKAVQNAGVYAFTFLVVAIHEGYFFFSLWKMSLIKEQKLLAENAKARYEVLKHQINPHFLFNSFNILSGLIDEDKEKAQQYLDDLTRFFRGSLIVQNDSSVLLIDEVEMAKHYIALQKIRFGKGVEVQWGIDESALQSRIAPMTLQILLENTFKHNSTDIEKPLIINIKTDGKYIAVENNIQARIENTSGTGTGLSNLRERYKLLCGTDIIVEIDDYYRVKIPLIYENNV